MMTHEQRTTFTKITDVNWEIVKLKNELNKAEMLMYNLDNELRESMGVKAYNDLMESGKKMFAPSV